MMKAAWTSLLSSEMPPANPHPIDISALSLSESAYQGELGDSIRVNGPHGNFSGGGD